ncbi:DsbA family oxidoreductase [Antarcticimicrobium luteum]|uniref:DsbA family oxidoreductase n=1 Tax=Antarcticimicrobium luteum TaxID=2547397 RepID=A0A4R5UVQ6_9RHOB|nr:DsbA family oxidoreductase [Antarcticimicrobium luteum]TDK43165.1 DsbA family oxidoreductase [Antarcticimicrobium luteum]
MTTPSPPSAARSIQIDIVSDVVCPWCIIGFLQLRRALSRTGLAARLRWHPFELNPDMPPGGENLRAHMMRKYGVTAADSQRARDKLVALGNGLGFSFAFTDDSRIVNTFAAHQLLDWAEGQGRQHDLKLALFHAYFARGEDVSDPAVLEQAAVTAGLDGAAARAALAHGSHAPGVRSKQQHWAERGVHGVPAMIFDQTYLVTGAQGVDGYEALLNRVAKRPG